MPGRFKESFAIARKNGNRLAPAGIQEPKAKPTLFGGPNEDAMSSDAEGRALIVM